MVRAWRTRRQALTQNSEDNHPHSPPPPPPPPRPRERESERARKIAGDWREGALGIPVYGRLILIALILFSDTVFYLIFLTINALFMLFCLVSHY